MHVLETERVCLAKSDYEITGAALGRGRPGIGASKTLGREVGELMSSEVKARG